MTVAELIHMLQSLPACTEIFIAGEEGVFECERGNLFPLKVYRNKKNQITMYIDDGMCGLSPLIDDWVGLDEFCGINGSH